LAATPRHPWKDHETTRAGWCRARTFDRRPGRGPITATAPHAHRARRASFPLLGEFEMYPRWRRHRSHQREPVQIIVAIGEQPLTAAEERRHLVDLHLVDQSSGKKLRGRLRPAGER